MVDEPQEKKLRGFAAMSPERRREIAAKGGRSVEPQERSFSRDPALAARAGRIGGERRSNSQGESLKGSAEQAQPKPKGSDDD